jgi:chromate transporter
VELNTTTQISTLGLAKLFARLGATSFGGPAAHIAMMEEEFVRRRKWLSKQDFLDLLGATNLIPGPNSTEMAIHIGYRMGGWRGLLAAGAAFILPAFFIVWAAAWFYVRFGSLPEFRAVFAGVMPVIVAVIAQAVWSLSKSAVKDRALAVLGLCALGAYFIWRNEIAILATVALANLLLRMSWRPKGPLASAPVDMLFLFFLKVGSVLFGSGYVLIAFLQDELVNKYQWLSNQQLMDAIAVGQFTPGPVFTTATFIGYLTAGNSGAVAATVGIFAPAFFFVALSAPFLPKLRRSLRIAYLLDGLNVASLSLMAAAIMPLAQDAIADAYGIGALAISAVLLIRYKINSAWLVLAGGLMGLVTGG